MAVLDVFLKVLHVFVCLVLMFVVLLQQGRGGGLGAAFGGGAASQVFGGRGAGNILTRATAICAATFMLTSVSLAYRSSSQDRALAARVELEKMRKAEKGTHKKRESRAHTERDHGSHHGNDDHAPDADGHDAFAEPERIRFALSLAESESLAESVK